MPRLTQKLDRLERAVRDLGGAVCRLCYGTPVAAIHVMHEVDPNGPGLRATGDRYLSSTWSERVTDGLCCRRCGAPAVQMQLMDVVGIGPVPTGRKLPPAERINAVGSPTDSGSPA